MFVFMVDACKRLFMGFDVMTEQLGHFRNLPLLDAVDDFLVRSWSPRGGCFSPTG